MFRINVEYFVLNFLSVWEKIKFLSWYVFLAAPCIISELCPIVYKSDEFICNNLKRKLLQISECLVFVWSVTYNVCV